MLKTKIKRANWKSKGKFLFQYPKVKLKITLEGYFGVMYPKAYRLYVYNLIYKKKKYFYLSKD